MEYQSSPQPALKKRKKSKKAGQESVRRANGASGEDLTEENARLRKELEQLKGARQAEEEEGHL